MSGDINWADVQRENDELRQKLYAAEAVRDAMKGAATMYREQYEELRAAAQAWLDNGSGHDLKRLRAVLEGKK